MINGASSLSSGQAPRSGTQHPIYIALAIANRYSP